ncbi:OLC1v1004343C1 [Oldenlandia corymbosa var. corymbosa]|uniref:pectinesterase n=1 Tax=Oldenlandia corymbosa var. corymbosa TaxID=529605 RepID=A0AAV1DCC1_OLDCO|nr:OLC1v1004343C1 [Oldenlandia corymbosa var. corymbosa]
MALPFHKTYLSLCMLFVIGSGLWPASSSSSGSITTEDDVSSYVQDACSVTRYPEICIHSLSSYSNTARKDPSKWARAGVSVTITEAKVAARYACRLKTRNSSRGRTRVAVSDCVELFQDTLDVLHNSLYALRNITYDSSSSSSLSSSVVEDIMTWLSAALTNEDTCLDGFNAAGSEDWLRGKDAGKGIRGLRDRVSKASYMTSNALALVNRLASSGSRN